ncbi:unnamed protein product [Bursaphelenchus okinawaensis]|uniref:t-SNARE coiled-coil homology domain-containing protein n=1 Tax=Bursaphelenchus okinawaensis TaxID=465554 RepID=A0A811K9F8_9BILA|nr:unnamed protein product [Bursaphelenchus okinawaensis]CAG9094912.1 unnamed protein product [Bursaphelenchus okinawaensis]
MKDRLAELQKLRGQTRGSSPSVIFNGTSVRLEDGFPVVSDNLLDQDAWDDMENFHANVDNVLAKLDEMDSLLKKLSVVHREILISPGMDTKYKTEMNDIVNNFKALSKTISAFLTGLGDEVKRIGDQNDASSRIKRDHSRTLTRKFQNLLKEFNNEQLHYKEQSEKTISKYLKISGVQLDEDQVDEAIEKGELFNTVSVLMGDRDKKSLYEDVKSRHDDIIKLEASIRELHEIFQDMAMLVESQGEVLDRIDTNVQYATDYAQKALTNVNQAQQAQRRNMMMKVGMLICGIILIIILFILISSAFLRLRSSEAATKSSLETYRAKLYYQSKKRGILENDILVGGFADKELGKLSEAELKEYDVLINGDIMEWDLFYYLSDKKEPPEEVKNNSAFKKMKEFVAKMKQ